MTAAFQNIDELVVRDDTGRVHERNPLGHVCLGCALPFPCPTALGGEQLHLGDWPRSFVSPTPVLWDGFEVIHCQRMPDGRYAVSRVDARTVLVDREALAMAGITP